MLCSTFIILSLYALFLTFLCFFPDFFWLSLCLGTRIHHWNIYESILTSSVKGSCPNIKPGRVCIYNSSFYTFICERRKRGFFFFIITYFFSRLSSKPLISVCFIINNSRSSPTFTVHSTVTSNLCPHGNVGSPLILWLFCRDVIIKYIIAYNIIFKASQNSPFEKFKLILFDWLLISVILITLLLIVLNAFGVVVLSLILIYL